MSEWGERWEIYNGYARDSRLQKYLTSGPLVGNHVLVTLVAISNILANTEKLEKSYGIKIKHRPAVGYTFVPARHPSNY